MAIRILLALLSGLLLVLLYPPFGFNLLAPIALAPLLVGLGKEYRPAGRFALGFAAGVVLWAGVCWWIAPVLAVHGGMGTGGGWGTFVLFCVLKSVHYGVFGMLSGALLRHNFGPPAIALLWAALERTQEPLTLFGWLMLGDAGIDMGLPLRVAPFAGVYGISFLFALTASCMAAILLKRPRNEALWALFTLVPAFLPALPTSEAPTAHAAVIQPNLPTAEDWNTDTYAAAKERLTSLSYKALEEGGVDAVIWPETPGPMFYEQDADLRTRVKEVSGAAKAPVVLGMIRRDATGAPYNSAKQAPDGPTYDKVYLVPFGEYVPSLFSFVNQVSDEAGAYQRGRAIPLMPMRQGNAGTFICYESAVADHVRAFARAGAQVFFNISNDGYFFETPAREQHLQLVRMRAAENRRWIVRATNNGITAVVDPSGAVREQLPSFDSRSGRVAFGFVRETTVFSLYGDWFPILAGVLATAALLASQLPHYKKSSRRPTAVLR
ncbi:MAG TPA: apolipoprotein N-acyltransferase [Bryobacteraceae bacterium]|nr:apolipoprotein N-acyltransferase [Bryobacteraceae bacterium]